MDASTITRRPRLEYYNVKEHQEQSLMEFDATGKHTHGILAVEFYDKSAYSKTKRMFLLPIADWMRFKETSDRSSMPISAFEEYGTECHYEHGAYVLDFSRWFS